MLAVTQIVCHHHVRDPRSFTGILQGKSLIRPLNNMLSDSNSSQNCRSQSGHGRGRSWLHHMQHCQRLLRFILCFMKGTQHDAASGNARQPHACLAVSSGLLQPR